MARKITPPKQQSSAPDQGADDLEVLNPDITLTVAGRKITVREYRFIDGLRIRGRSSALVKDLQTQIETGEALTEDVMDVLAKHQDLVLDLIAEATEGADRDWIDALDDDAGELLMLTWWAVCGPFFVRQITRRLTERAMIKAQAAQAHSPTADGATSSPSSPPPDTAMTKNSSDAAADAS